jgi:hypothetical protein
VDLLRRLLLTGGLILVGEQSNTQIFLGALLCLLWLVLVMARRPYASYWDNVLSIILSLQLMLIMLCGIALELNRLTPKKAADPYDSRLFGILMVTFSVIIVLIGLLAILFSVPFLRDFVIAVYMKRCDGSNQDEAEPQPERNGLADEGSASANRAPAAHKKTTPKRQRRLSSRDLIRQHAQPSSTGAFKNSRVEPSARVKRLPKDMRGRTTSARAAKGADVGIEMAAMHSNPMQSSNATADWGRHCLTETVHKDPKTGRRYSHDTKTGETKWLPKDKTG